MNSRFYSAVLACISIVSPVSIKVAAQSRFFSVEDSISMTTFNRPSGTDATSQTDYSPDGRYVTVVTSRGLLATNQIESTIWLLKADAVSHFLKGDDASPPKDAVPHRIATIRATPDISTNDTYMSMISDIQWSQDSRRLYFLGMDSHHERRLYELVLSTGVSKALTPIGWGVRQYTVVGPRVAYSAIQTASGNPTVPWDNEHAINKDAGSVTGLGLEAILFPEDGQGAGAGIYVPDLWVGASGGFQHVPIPSGKQHTLDVEHDANALGLSPDGRKIIRLFPITSVDKSWSIYDPKPGFESWRINPTDNYLTSPFYRSRLREYVLVDTVTGKQEPLIHAPNGRSLAEEDATIAVWSKDGYRALLGNVALPANIADPEELQKRKHTCALASVDIASKAVHCVRFTRDASVVITDDNPHPLRLQNAEFGVNDDEAILHFAWHGRWGQTERYHFDGKQWSLVDSLPGDPITGKPLNDPEAQRRPSIQLSIKQDLNTPPQLWASFQGSSKLLWDPNPQLDGMKLGKAAVYHWQDKQKRDWKGILLLPADYIPGKRYPLIIQTHGFRENVFMTDGIYPTAMAARPLSSAGFVVLQTDNIPDHYVSAQEPLDAIDSWEAAIALLDTQGVIDKAKVGIIGFSRTCWYVEKALTLHPHMFSAASITDGIDSSYMTYRIFGEGRPGLAKEYQKIIGAEPFGTGLKRWMMEAPGFTLDHVQTPLRIEAIGRASMLMEWETYSSLRERHRAVDLIYIPDGQHILKKPLDRMASQQGNVDWFRFWLQDHEDPAPDRENQYERWEHLRELQDADDKASIPPPSKPN